MNSAVSIESLSFLVIDDDEFMLDIVAMNLNHLKAANVATCTNGCEALARIDNGESFDVVMIDLNMPIIDGVEVLRSLAQRNFPNGILLFSGEDARILKTAQSLANEHKLNVLGALTKPVVVNDLQEALQAYRPNTTEAPQKLFEPITVDELYKAINEKQILPYFQPQVLSRDKSLVAAEVLARWQHPERGLLAPFHFIARAEELSLIDELTWSLFEQAIEQFGRWRTMGTNLSMSINLSADSLGTVNLPEKIASLVAANHIPYDAIRLEITESRLMKNLKTSLDVLARLRLKNFGLSIDDFGTGYSSLAQLNSIPFNELKVDRAFVHGAAADPAARAILESSVMLARKLDMTVVAEGVEDQSDWDQVEAIGCDLVQGYHVARPMPADQFEQWMETWNERTIA
ncbi:MAG: EAL domain-containing response regulator [Sedimenticola sp.]